MGIFNDVVLVPLLNQFGIHPDDPTFGRYELPTTEFEKDLEPRPYINTRTRRVFYRNLKVASDVKGYPVETLSPVSTVKPDYIEVQEGEDIKFTSAEVARGKGRRWVVYKVYEDTSPQALGGKGRGCDIVFSHGKCHSPQTLPVLKLGPNADVGMNGYGGTPNIQTRYNLCAQPISEQPNIFPTSIVFLGWGSGSLCQTFHQSVNFDETSSFNT